MRADPAGVLIPPPTLAQKVGRCRSGGQDPQGDPQRPVPHHVTLAEAGISLQLSLLTFADFSFKVILYLTGVVP